MAMAIDLPPDMGTGRWGPPGPAFPSGSPKSPDVCTTRMKPHITVAERSCSWKPRDKGWARHRAVKVPAQLDWSPATSDGEAWRWEGPGGAEDRRTRAGPPQHCRHFSPPCGPLLPKGPVPLITCQDWETQKLPQTQAGQGHAWPGRDGRAHRENCDPWSQNMPDGAARAPGWADGTQWQFRACFRGWLPDLHPGCWHQFEETEPLQVVTSRWNCGQGGGLAEMTSEHWPARTPGLGSQKRRSRELPCSSPSGQKVLPRCVQEPQTVRAPPPRLCHAAPCRPAQPGPTPRGRIPEGSGSGVLGTETGLMWDSGG